MVNNGLVLIANDDNDNMENTEYLDFDNAVQFLKTTPSTLYKWLQGGKIAGHRLGRQWRFFEMNRDSCFWYRLANQCSKRFFESGADFCATRTKHKESDVNTNPGSIVEALIWDALDRNADHSIFIHQEADLKFPTGQIQEWPF